MTRTTQFITLAFIALFSVHSSSQEEPKLVCNIGPISAIFGGTNWTLYSCTDELSISLVSTPKSPAHPFYFMLLNKDGEYTLLSEDNEKKNAAKAARVELEALSKDEIQVLIKKTKSVHSQ